MFEKILVAVCLMGAGIALMRYTRAVYRFTGRFAWAEIYLWSGGTVLFLRITGILFFIFGILYPFGYFDMNPSLEETVSTDLISK